MGGPRRKRSGRRGGARQANRPAAPFIARKIPFVDPLDEEALIKLEDQADWLTQEVGLEFRGDGAALRLWKDAGADVEEARVRAPKGIIRELCKTAPGQFTQVARNPARSV